MGINGGTCYNEHRVMYVSDESPDFTPGTNMALYGIEVILGGKKVNHFNYKYSLRKVRKIHNY